MAGNAIVIFYTLTMAQRATKHTLADETKSVVSLLADAPVTGLPKGMAYLGRRSAKSSTRSLREPEPALRLSPSSWGGAGSGPSMRSPGSLE